MAERGPMLNRAADRNGSCCGAPSGLDCADYSKTRHQQRRIEKREWRREELAEAKTRSVDDPIVNIRP
jgi:hypothetical protein